MEFIDFVSRKPSDSEIVTFFRMMFSKEQQEMEFQYTEHFNKMSDFEILTYYNKNMSNSENLGYWCSASDRTVGMIGVNRCKDTYNSHIGKIGFGVDKDFRRLGIGSKLIDMAERRAGENGIIRLECSCLHINKPAVSLLKKLKYSEEGRKSKAVYKNGIYYDRIMMGKILKSV